MVPSRVPDDREAFKAKLLMHAAQLGLRPGDPIVKEGLMQLHLDAADCLQHTLERYKLRMAEGLLEEAEKGNEALAEIQMMDTQPIEEDHYLGYHLLELTKGALGVGTPGSGKTEVCKQVTYQMVSRNVPALILTPKPQDWVPFVSIFKDKVLYVDAARDFALNPLFTGCLEDETPYWMDFADIMAEEGIIKGKPILVTALRMAYEKGIRTWPEFASWIVSLKPKQLGSRYAWKENLDGTIAPIHSRLGHTFLSARDCRHLRQVYDEKKLLLLGTSGLGDYQRLCSNILVNCFVQFIREDFEYGITPADGLPALFIGVDEGQGSYLRHPSSEHHGATVVEQRLTRDFRALRIAFFGLAQNLALLAHSVINTPYLTLVFSSGNRDLLFLKDALGDTYEIAQHLTAREAIALLKGRVRLPMRIRTLTSPPEFFQPPPREELQQMSLEFGASVARVQTQNQASTPPKPTKKKEEDGKSTLKSEEGFSLTPDEHTMVEAFRRNPDPMEVELVEYVDQLPGKDRIPKDRARKTLKGLTGKEFFETFPVERKGKPSRAYTLTPAAEDYMRQVHGRAYNFPRLRGSGPLHNYMAYRVVKYASVVYGACAQVGDTETVKHVDGLGELDVVLTFPEGSREFPQGGTMAIEIEISSDNLTLQRVEKILSVVDRLVILTPQSKVDKLKHLESDTVEVHPLSQFNLSNRELAKLKQQLQEQQERNSQ